MIILNKNYYTYIATNRKNDIFYTGVTNNLKRIIFEHRNRIIKGFSSKYNVNKLVYFEHFTNIEDATKREEQIKKWKNQLKIELIEKINSTWDDLYYNI